MSAAWSHCLSVGDYVDAISALACVTPEKLFLMKLASYS